jgi:glyoxylase-like metal-dependent hydrolase (beta-lactamase superfamily II)
MLLTNNPQNEASSSGRRRALCGIRTLVLIGVLPLLFTSVEAQPKPVKSVRLYVFDCGAIKGLGMNLFNMKESDVKEASVVVPCYLIVDPKGTLMWDVGVIPDTAFKADGAPVKQGVSTVTRPLLPQLAAVGYTPADIKYVAFSHYHSDHTANANAFAGSTWLVRKEERDAMFAEKPAGIIQQSFFKDLKDSKTIILDKDEYDVFGDGKVMIKSAPGHTPGHMVLLVKLKKTGPILVAGDLYHYPEEKTLNRFPTFEFNKEQSAASRKAIDEYLQKNHAKMWIEHDKATFDSLKKAPDYYE